jgi:transcriptional regulator with XRE-family HTH domain
MAVMDLRSYRKAHGLTLEQIAQRLGVSSVTVHRWEVSKSRPNLQAVADITALTAGSVTAADFMPTPTPGLLPQDAA